MAGYTEPYIRIRIYGSVSDPPAISAKKATYKEIKLDRPLNAGETTACLSMHQPWASLLVYGIKTVEGRSWPTTHRGAIRNRIYGSVSDR